jgi:hypothetical protein
MNGLSEVQKKGVMMDSIADIAFGMTIIIALSFGLVAILAIIEQAWNWVQRRFGKVEIQQGRLVKWRDDHGDAHESKIEGTFSHGLYILCEDGEDGEHIGSIRYNQVISYKYTEVSE